VYNSAAGQFLNVLVSAGNTPGIGAYITSASASAAFQPVGNYAELNVANEWTQTQNFNATSLTDAVSVAWDLQSNQVTSLTLGGNRTLQNPTNLVDGATYILTVRQDGVGGRTLAYGSAYQFPGGTAPTLSTSTSAVDIITFVCDGTNMRGVFQGEFG
jgi:hypothetical protein